jgi:hypothetical protein
MSTVSSNGIVIRLNILCQLTIDGSKSTVSSDSEFKAAIDASIKRKLP